MIGLLAQVGSSPNGFAEMIAEGLSLGSIYALLGMGLQNDWLIGAAGLVLAGGVALRFVGRDREVEPPQE